LSQYIGPKASDIPVGTIGTGTVSANSLVVGSNVSLTTTQLSVGNSSVNTVANSTAFYSSGNAFSPYGMKNRIINGDMRIWQRGTNFTNPTNAATAYAADRWSYYRGAYTANVAASQTTGLTINGNNRNALRIQRTANDANTATVNLSQQIESQNIRDLAGQTITVSAWVRVGTNFSASNLNMYVVTGTGVDESVRDAGFTGLVIPFNVQIPSSTTTYTKFTGTATLNSNINELALQFNYVPAGTAGANDWFEIIDVQLEAGSVATPFERRQYGSELSLCQRYYEFVSGGISGYCAGSTIARGGVQFKISKRATPTIDKSITGTAYVNFTGANPLITSYSLQIATPDGVYQDFITSGTFTSGQGCLIYLPVSTLSYSAEL